MSKEAQHIEALLFTFGSLSRKELAQKLSLSENELQSAVAELMSREGGGVVLVDDGKNLELRSSSEAARVIEKARKEEYARDIGRAGLEALAAILYRGPLTRSEIDFIRGVNSSQTLRTLAMRGLVRKITNPKDERSFLYEATPEVLGQLGVTRAGELPQFEEVREKLKTLEESYRAKEAASQEAGQ